MTLNVSGFPFASYDPGSKTGHLVDYYPYDAKKTGSLSHDQWREGSHSPEILNFKDGADYGIQYWVTPFIQLIHHVLTLEGLVSAVLVPVPTSMPKGDNRYSRIPKTKPTKPDARSRDDRIIIFCSKLLQSDPNLQTSELIERITYKPEKSGLSLEDHVATMRLHHTIQSNGKSPAIILVDDVRTEGTTFKACEEVLRRDGQPKGFIASLSLALTKNPTDFRDLRNP
jgi:hypothetical protein